MSGTKIFILVLSTSILSSGITYFASSTKAKPVSIEIVNTEPPQPLVTVNGSTYRVERMQGYRYIKPLMYGERIEEPKKYTALKTELTQILNEYKRSNTISTASVYLRDFEKADWMGINTDAAFHPGSLMKLPVMITYLKQNEVNPGLLDRKLVLDKLPNGFPNQTFNSKQIVVGKPYTIRELLEYMISYSDNNATYLLNSNIDLEAFKKVFVDIHLLVPDVKDRFYTTTTKEYSTFFVVLYNAGYLTIDDSEFAMSLMSKCDFTKGFMAGMPATVPMVHKFGEWSDAKTIHELHETGIIYINGKAYILSVMTSGFDVQKLPEIISRVSKTVYENLNIPGTSDKVAMVQNRTFH